MGGDFVYQYDDIKKDFLELKQKCHSIGLNIYAGKNRIRSLGDSMTCCGVDGLSGFQPNTFNLNHILNGDKVLPSPQQKTDGTAGCFQSLFQDSLRARMCAKNSFADWMVYYYKTRRGARAGNVAHFDFANFKNLTHAIEAVRISKTNTENRRGMRR